MLLCGTLHMSAATTESSLHMMCHMTLIGGAALRRCDVHTTTLPGVLSARWHRHDIQHLLQTTKPHDNKLQHTLRQQIPAADSGSSSGTADRPHRQLPCHQHPRQCAHARKHHHAHTTPEQTRTLCRKFCRMTLRFDDLTAGDVLTRTDTGDPTNTDPNVTRVVVLEVHSNSVVVEQADGCTNILTRLHGWHHTDDTLVGPTDQQILQAAQAFDWPDITDRAQRACQCGLELHPNPRVDPCEFCRGEAAALLAAAFDNQLPADRATVDGWWLCHAQMSDGETFSQPMPVWACRDEHCGGPHQLLHAGATLPTAAGETAS